MIGILVTSSLNFSAHAKVKSKRKNSTSVTLNIKKISISKTSKDPLDQIVKIKLRDIKPPKPNGFAFPPGTDLQELERVTDTSIKYLYNLAKRYKKDKDRADIWLRLARQYFEKSKLIKLKLHESYHKGKKYKKNINFKASHVYNKKSLKLYLWFLKTFPNDKRSEEVYVFAIKNYLLFDQIEPAVSLYNSFLKKYSRGVYKEELSFLIGDYYFSKFFWKKAKGFFRKTLKSSTKKLKFLVYYKLAWIEHKMNRYKSAFYYLDLVLNNAQSNKLFSFKAVAVKDLPYFYSRYGSASSASRVFLKYMAQADLPKSLSLLADYYLADGKQRSAVLIWKKLLAINPMAENNFDYTYKIIQSYKYNQSVAQNNILVKKWLTNYGFNSEWFKFDKKNRTKYVQKQKKYLRYLIFTFYNQKKVKNKSKRIKILLSLYPLYLQNFSIQATNQNNLLEIKFLYANLLFSQKKYGSAQKQYAEIVSFGKTKFYKKALYNQVLCSEKRLSSYAEIKKKTNNFSKKIAILGAAKQFETATLQYLKIYTDLNLKYRLGLFYYNRVQLDLAEKTLSQYLKNTATSRKNTISRKQALSWLVDIYSKQKKYKKIKSLFLNNKNLATSSKFKTQQDKVYFKVAEDLEKEKKYLQAIKEYSKVSFKNSSLLTSSLFNQANLYLKINDISTAIRFFKKINFTKNQNLYKKANLSLVSIYREKGLYSQVAKTLEALAKHKFKEAADWYYNAGILRKDLKNYRLAINNFNQFLLLTKNLKQKRKVQLILVDIYIAMNRLSQSIGLLKTYYNLSKNYSEKYYIAEKLIQVYQKMNELSKSSWWQNKLLSEYTKRRAVFAKDVVIVSIVAKIKYTQAEQAFSKLLKLRFSKKLSLQNLNKEKFALLEVVKTSLKAVVSLSNSEYLLKALVLEARAQSHMAHFFTNLPIPSSLKGKNRKDYIKGVKDFTNPMLLEGKKLYQLTLDKASEFEVYNEAVVFAYNQLQGEQGKSVKTLKLSYLKRLKVKFMTSGEFLYKIKYEKKFTTYNNMKKFALSGIANNTLNQDYWFILVSSYIGLGYLDLADLILEDNDLLNKNISAYYNDKAILAWRLNKIGQSISFFKKISRSALFTESYAGLNLAFMYASYSEFAKAGVILDYLNKKNYTFSVLALNNYAIVKEQSGKAFKAKNLYKEALKKDEGNPLILFNYAYLLFQTNTETSSIISLLERAKVWNKDKKLLKLIKILENKIKARV